MRRFMMAVAFGLTAFTLSVADASAQATVVLTAGLTVPTGDYAEFPEDVNDGAKAGWMGQGAVTFPVGAEGLFLGAGGFYGSNKHEFEGDKTNLFGGSALVGFRFGEPDMPGGFVYAGGGLMSHQYKSDDFPSLEGTDSGFALSGGAGATLPLGTVNGILSASFTRGFGDVEGTTFFGVSAGLGIPVGGNGM